MEPTMLPQPLMNNEIGVQTPISSLFDFIKTWLKTVFDLNTEEVEEITFNQEAIVSWA
jgi:hypothetical protein